MRVDRFLAVAIFLLAFTPAAAHAQSMADCNTSRPRSVGGSIGRSSPYFEPNLGTIDSTGSVHSRGGFTLAARTDLPIAGPWRARLQAGATSWRLERQIYSADLTQVIATETAARIKVRDVVALVGRQAGRPPACAYVLAGGGLYSLNYEGRRSHFPGVALMAGIEFPGGARGAVQVDVQLHFINTGTGFRPPTGSTTILDGRLAAGWMFRF